MSAANWKRGGMQNEEYEMQNAKCKMKNEEWSRIGLASSVYLLRAWVFFLAFELFGMRDSER